MLMVLPRTFKLRKIKTKRLFKTSKVSMESETALNSANIKSPYGNKIKDRDFLKCQQKASNTVANGLYLLFHFEP